MSDVQVSIAGEQQIVITHAATGQIVIRVVDPAMANPLVSTQTVDAGTAVTPVSTDLPVVPVIVSADPAAIVVPPPVLVPLPPPPVGG